MAGRNGTAGPVSAGDVAAALLDVVPAVMRSIRMKMREATSAELTVVQFRSLALADFQPGGASVSDIADHIGLTMPSASKLIDGLVRRGYLRRRSDPNDRRMTLLVSTTKGRRVLGTALRATRRHLAGRLDAVSADQLWTVTEALELLGPIFLERERKKDRPKVRANS